MLQWGPESERCYRPKRLGFQCPANKRQSSPQRERGDGGLQGWESVSAHIETVVSEGTEASVSEECSLCVCFFYVVL